MDDEVPLVASEPDCASSHIPGPCRNSIRRRIHEVVIRIKLENSVIADDSAVGFDADAKNAVPILKSAAGPKSNQ
jgi:hypothetical protein